MITLTAKARLAAVTVLLAAAALAAAPAAGQAAAAGPPPRAGENPPDVFTLQNLTPYPLVTTSVPVSLGDGGQPWSLSWGSRFPYPGQVIEPGQTAYYDLAFYYNGPTGNIVPSAAWVTYTIGAGGTALKLFMWQNGKGWPFHQTAFDCQSDSPGYNCSVPNNSSTATLQSAASHTTVVPDTNQALQAQIMQLCRPGLAVTCTFSNLSPHLTKVDNVGGYVVGDALYNYTSEPAEHSVTSGWETGTSFKLGGAYSPVDIDVEGLVKAEVKLTYDHEWGTSHAEDVTYGIDVSHDQVGFIKATIPGLQFTGDLHVSVGNDSWTLQNATFASPDTTAGSFSWTANGRSQEMTQSQKDNPPPTP